MMRLFYSSRDFARPDVTVAAALGNFDGVHRGHQTILREMVAQTKARGQSAGIYTFEPHPAKVLAPASAPKLIQTLEQKLKAFEPLGIDWVVLEPFDASFAKMMPETFFEEILCRRMQAKALWVGYDFTFGVRRSGSVVHLKGLCKEQNIALHITEPQFTQDVLVSSSRIRELVLQGEAAQARMLLGRPFALIGTVVKGAGIGAKLGIHTANLAAENELLPKPGIYITTTRLEEKDYPSVTNVGMTPTFPGKGFSIETHILNFDQTLTGKKIEILFLDWLREEKSFSSTEALVAAIQKDIDAAKDYHGCN